MNEYDIWNLAWWLSSDDEELEQDILQQACDTREVYGKKPYFRLQQRNIGAADQKVNTLI